MNTWQLQEAKARLSEVIKKAKKDGPQSITVHGQPSVVVLSSGEYERPNVQFTLRLYNTTNRFLFVPFY